MMIDLAKWEMMIDPANWEIINLVKNINGPSKKTI